MSCPPVGILPLTMVKSEYFDHSQQLTDTTELKTGNTGNVDARRALLAFDLAGSIPAGATILSAELTLNQSRTIAGPTMYPKS